MANGTSWPTQWNILFLRESQDTAIYRRVLTATERASLQDFLREVFTNFENAFRASARNPAYRGLLENLCKPSQHAWTTGWQVYWHIGLRQTPPPRTPFGPADYVLYLEKLKRED